MVNPSGEKDIEKAGEAAGRWGLGGLVGLAAGIALVQSRWKLVWGDELITFYVSQAGSVRGIWRALAAGADPNPPLTHVLVMLSTRLVGANALGMRLPSILFGAMAVASAHLLLRRWVRPGFAAVGVLLFLGTRGFDYTYDARSYAPMMGLTMLGLLLWTAAKDRVGSGRVLAVAGMATALAAAVSTNYYGVLAFFPIAAGEAVAEWEKRRWRPGVWVGMLVGALPLVVYLPLIRHNIAEFGPHAWNQPRWSVVGWSYLELVEGVFWPVAAMAAYAWWRGRGADGPGSGRAEIDRAEGAAVWVLLLYPFLGFAIAAGGAGMISTRCVVPVCCGFGLAGGVLAQRIWGGNKRAAAVLVAVMLVWVGVREGVCAGLLRAQQRNFFALRDEVAAAGGEGEVLVGDSSFALPLYFYSGAGVQGRMRFPVDFEAIHRLEPDDSGEENLWAGRRGVFPFPVVEFETVRTDVGEVVICRPGGWLAESIAARGVAMRMEDDGRFWGDTGGVFTPMAHPETRRMRVVPAGARIVE